MERLLPGAIERVLTTWLQMGRVYCPGITHGDVMNAGWSGLVTSAVCTRLTCFARTVNSALCVDRAAAMLPGLHVPCAPGFDSS